MKVDLQQELLEDPNSRAKVGLIGIRFSVNFSRVGRIGGSSKSWMGLADLKK
jgi:hypothetical protein